MKQGFYVRGLPVTMENAPSVTVLPDGVNCILLESLTYVAASGAHHVAYPGLRTDGGSIPRPFWRLAGSPWTGKRRYGYIIHDQECENEAQLSAGERDDARRAADDLLFEMCQFLGEPISGVIVWAGVRIGWWGWIRWFQPRSRKTKNPHFLGTRISLDKTP